MTHWKLVPVEPTPEMAAVFIPESCKTGSWIDGYKAMLNAAPAPDVQPVAWTEREIELIDEMIEGQLIHSERLDSIPNRAMADKQKGWNMERVILLQKIKSAHPPAADVQELVDALRRLEEVASDCDIGYMDNAVRHARTVLEKWEVK